MKFNRFLFNDPMSPGNGFSKMKFIWGMLMVITFACLGCKKENDKDEYYVQYEVVSSTISTARHLYIYIKIRNSDDFFNINARNPYKQIIGPVKKGFKASLGVINDDIPDSLLRLAAKISVSKNNGPFTLKKVDENNAPRDNWGVSYTIDF